MPVEGACLVVPALKREGVGVLSKRAARRPDGAGRITMDRPQARSDDRAGDNRA